MSFGSDKDVEKAGSPVKKPYTYPGEQVELPDGTRIGKREQAITGGSALDVRLPNGEFIRVISDES